MRWLGPRGEREDFTFEDMHRESSRFANVLKANYLGLEAGDTSTLEK